MNNIINSQSFNLSSEKVELLVQAFEAYNDTSSLPNFDYRAITLQLPSLPSHLLEWQSHSLKLTS